MHAIYQIIYMSAFCLFSVAGFCVLLNFAYFLCVLPFAAAALFFHRHSHTVETILSLFLWCLALGLLFSVIVMLLMHIVSYYYFNLIYFYYKINAFSGFLFHFCFNAIFGWSFHAYFFVFHFFCLLMASRNHNKKYFTNQKAIETRKKHICFGLYGNFSPLHPGAVLGIKWISKASSK